MTLPRLLGICALVLFGAIGIAAWVKSGKSEVKRIETKATATGTAKPVEVAMGSQVRVVKPEPPAPKARPPEPAPVVKQPEKAAPVPVPVAAKPPSPVAPRAPQASRAVLPEADNMQLFFIRDPKQHLPIVETITYASKVPWLKGRPAWLSDYASHYRTSRHFIARSLHGKNEYFKQDVAEGNRFNVLRTDKNIAFYLLVDLTRSKMWFYYQDLDAKEKLLVKSYDIGVGRLDPLSESGFASPLGKYSLGGSTAVYRPKVRSQHNGQEVEMMTVFGTRWIPFGEEIADCTAPAKGLGLCGCPWTSDTATDKPREDTAGIGQHLSDGCISLRAADMEELFAVIVSRPTTIELVRDFFEAEVPGVEKKIESGVGRASFSESQLMNLSARR